VLKGSKGDSQEKQCGGDNKQKEGARAGEINAPNMKISYT
jgi:hypothetical protein